MSASARPGGAPRSQRSRLARIVTCLEVYVVLGGLVSLLGWVLDRQRWTDWDDNGISIQPNTTVAVTAAGVALILLSRGARRTAAALGVLVGLIGSSALFQTLSGVDLGIDTPLLFGRAWGRGATVSPGRMGPPGSVSWTLIGTALVLASLSRGARARRFAPVLASITASIATLALVGYLYGADTLYSLPHATVIALQTATFILAVSLCLIASVPEHGPMRFLREPGSEGVLIRRILPALVLVPIVVGFLRLSGERAGLYDAPFGSAMRTLFEILLFSLLVWRTAVILARKEGELATELEGARLLQGVSTELIMQEDPRRFYDSILDASLRLLHADFASLQTLRDAEGLAGELQLLAQRGWGPAAARLLEPLHPDSKSAAAEALRTGRRVIVADLGASPDPEERERWSAAGLRALQATPLVSRSGRELGILTTGWRKPREPRERELRLLDILARQAADLLERRQHERQREELLEKERGARSDAERAGRLKDEFLATLSHELRTPLHAVIGWSQILKNDLHDPEKARAALEVIERNGRLQAQLITDLLDVSRIVSGNMRLDVQAVDLRVIIGAAADSILPAAQAKGVGIHMLLESIGQPMHGDPARLQQVVWNLLSNAVKFTPRGGRVQVELARVDPCVEIRVSDSGEGIPPEFLPHLFERFRQADSSASRSHGGLGLGLAIAKQFTELHGGRVRASSAGKGQGASFIVELPLAPPGTEVSDLLLPQPRPGIAEPVRHASVDLPGIRALLVDDEPDALALIRRELEGHGAVVVSALSAAEALRLVEDHAFDVIVSDISMPACDGYRLLAELRARGIGAPALALTAFASPEDHDKALAAGFQAHVSKPIRVGELLASVAALVGKDLHAEPTVTSP